MLVASLLAAPAAKADPLASCQERVAACEELVDKASTAINEQSLTIDKLQEQNHLLQSSLNYELDQQAKEEVWYRDPKTVGPVSFVLGVALGAWVTSRASK